MIQWIYKKTVEILVQVQTILINVKTAHQAVKHGARHKKWELKLLQLCFWLLFSVTVTLGNADAARHPHVLRQVCDLHHWSRLCTAGGEGTTAGLLQGYQQPWQGVS